MSEYQLLSRPAANVDIESAFLWYERQRAGLGSGFIEELTATYERMLDGPLKYQDLGSGVRRASLRRFPYAVYFAVEQEVIVVLAVLHASRNPAEWQRRQL